MAYLDEEGRIPTYRVQEEFELMEKLPSSKPSKRIVKTKKGLRAIKALIKLEQDENESWYTFLYKRNLNNLDDLALFYRGTKISFREMFSKADEVAKSMAKLGLIPGDEVGVCISNSPELVYIILAANKLGLKVNLFGSNYDKELLSQIVSSVDKKVLFVSDDNYEQIADVVKDRFDRLVLTSLTDSLPSDPRKCDEYEPTLDSYYHFENRAISIVENNDRAERLCDFVNFGRDYLMEIKPCGDLETDFLVTYTSGSTRIGFPSEIVHKNRSLITIGKFHDPELCGNPKIPGLRGLAHIHPDSNTNIITCISDNLMQGWSVALEPEYDEKKALDYVMINKPNYLNATTSFIIEMAKQYLMDRRFHEDGKGRKLSFLLATFAVGEGTSKGEEKFINRFLRESRAGSGVSVKGFRFPYTPLSVGGGDCEHGGIYYTLWKSLYQKLYSPILGKNDLGLLPVPYVVVTALKKDNDGNYVECDYNEYGIIVANSFSNLSCYKNNPKKTEELILEDNLGRKWISCKTYGFIDKVGGVHVKGRIPDKKSNLCETFQIDDIVTADTKNIMSSTTVEVDGKLVSTIQFQPMAKVNEQKTFESLARRVGTSLSEEIIDSIYVRIIPPRDSYPLTGAGKRSYRQLEKYGLENTIKLTDLIKKNSKDEKVLIIKQ